MTGSGYKVKSKKSCQAGGENSGPFTIRVLGPSVTPKSNNWQESRQQPSGYQQPKMRSIAGGVPHPTMLAWDAEIFSLNCLLGSKTPEMFKCWGRMKPWDWPKPSSGVSCGWELPQDYSMVLSRPCAGVLHLSLRRITYYVHPCWRSQRRRPRPTQALQKRPGPWVKNQNPRKRDKPLCISKPSGRGFVAQGSWQFGVDGHCMKTATTSIPRIWGATGWWIRAASPGGCWLTLGYTPGYTQGCT